MLEKRFENLSLIPLQNTDELICLLEDEVGRIKSIAEVNSGLIHYVFRIVGEDQTAYLKIRSNHYARIPDISTDPSLIRDEFNALQLFSEKCPEYFPKVLLFNSIYHYLLLSDVMPNGLTLEDKYAKKAVTQEEVHKFGLVVGEIHKSTEDVVRPIRSPDDLNFQNKMLKYVFELSDNPILIKAAEEHRRREKRLLIGDPSPKNTYVEGEDVAFCDLESSHLGAIEYEQAFLLAHILLHQITRDSSIESIYSFIDGYLENMDIDLHDRLLLQSIKAVLLFRLVNPVVTYKLHFSILERKHIAQKIEKSLRIKTKNIEAIADQMFS